MRLLVALLDFLTVATHKREATRKGAGQILVSARGEKREKRSCGMCTGPLWLVTKKQDESFRSEKL